MQAHEVIQRLPTELASRLESDEYFVDIPVVVAGRGNLAQQLERKTAAVTAKTGKRGVAVVVLPLVGEDNHPNLPFGPLMLRPSFQVVENVELNQDNEGTGKPALEVARRIRDVIKGFGMGGICGVLMPDNPVIEPVDLEEELGPASAAYQVNFKCLEGDAEDVTAVQTPVLTVADGELTMTCGTAGATIIYTTDESYPRPGYGTVYEAPIPIPEDGLTVRACAYLSGSVASWVVRAEITAS